MPSVTIRPATGNDWPWIREQLGDAGLPTADIDRKLAELEGMRATLADLVQACHGDDRPDCPILDDLAGEGMGKGG